MNNCTAIFFHVRCLYLTYIQFLDKRYCYYKKLTIRDYRIVEHSKYIKERFVSIIRKI